MSAKGKAGAEGKTKLGILSCSNTTRVLDCPVSICLKDMHDRKGAFARYRGREIELVGMISCNGCPTVRGEDVILPKIEALFHYGADHIHLTYCMMALCPFVKKYIKVVKAKFPSIALIEGTHQPHQTDEQFRCGVAAMLKERKRTIIP
jgi:predicted metal-binding protein